MSALPCIRRVFRIVVVLATVAGAFLPLASARAQGAPVSSPADLAAESAAFRPVIPRVRALLPAPPATPVLDVAHLFDDATRTALLDTLRALRAETGAEVLILTLDSLGGAAAVDVATGAGRLYGVGAVAPVGSSRRHLGAVLLMVPKRLTHRGTLFLAPASGAQGFLTAADAGDIVRALVDEWRADAYAPAAVRGAHLIADAMRTSVPNPSPRVTAPTPAGVRQANGPTQAPAALAGLTALVDILMPLTALLTLVGIGLVAFRLLAETPVSDDKPLPDRARPPRDRGPAAHPLLPLASVPSVPRARTSDEIDEDHRRSGGFSWESDPISSSGTGSDSSSSGSDSSFSGGGDYNGDGAGTDV